MSQPTITNLEYSRRLFLDILDVCRAASADADTLRRTRAKARAASAQFAKLPKPIGPALAKEMDWIAVRAAAGIINRVPERINRAVTDIREKVLAVLEILNKASV